MLSSRMIDTTESKTNLDVERRRIGNIGRSPPLGPERLSGSSRVRSAAESLESPPQEAVVDCGATKAVLLPCYRASRCSCP